MSKVPRGRFSRYTEVIMHRELIDKLIEWKDDAHKKPLVVKGIPQCGKTYLLKEFGSRFYKEVFYFDFNEDKSLESLFDNNLNPTAIIKNMSLLKGIDIVSETTLIIFDNIDRCAQAVKSLGYFSDEASKYHIAAACSYMETAYPKTETLTLYPMNFYEFLLAQNSILALHLKESAFKNDSLKTFSLQLEEMFKDYQLVGGMPEVVQSWIDIKSIETVEKLQSRIISGFENDFTSLAPISMFPKLSAIWNAVASQLSKENRKFMFSRIKKSWRAKDLEDALYRLVRAGLVYKVEHISKPEFPLSGNANPTHFKLYMCDVGLLRRTAKIPASVILDKSNNFKELKAAIIENIVCNELKLIYEDELYYWSAEKPGRAEVEFIIQDGANIIPIVAKATNANRTRSLLQYTVRFSPKKSVLTALNTDNPDILPLYAFWNLKEWLKR